MRGKNLGSCFTNRHSSMVAELLGSWPGTIQLEFIIFKERIKRDVHKSQKYKRKQAREDMRRRRRTIHALVLAQFQCDSSKLDIDSRINRDGWMVAKESTRLILFKKLK